LGAGSADDAHRFRDRLHDAGGNLGIMEAAPAELSGAASAVFNAARQTGSAIGVALVGTLAAGGGLVAGLHANVIVGGLSFLIAAALTTIAIRP
jgi:DHA2 family methylenomycin A resistance protein-like MFS transporter